MNGALRACYYRGPLPRVKFYTAESTGNKTNVRGARAVGHCGTGGQEIRTRKSEEVGAALPLIEQALEGEL